MNTPKSKGTPATRDTIIASVSTPENEEQKPLFEREWDEFVIKRDADGRFRNYTHCCGMLTPV